MNWGTITKLIKINIKLSKMKFDINDVLENIRKKVKEINSNGQNIEFLGFQGGEWINTKTRLLMRCNEHNVEGSTRYYELLKNGWRCSECKKIAQKGKGMISPQEARSRVEKVFENNNPDNYDFSKIEDTFTGYKNNVTITCPIHGDFQVKYYTLINCKKIKCPKCRPLSAKEATKRINTIIETKLNNSIEFLGFVNDCWNGRDTKLILKCKVHNCIWESTTYGSLCSGSLKGISRCPECAKDSRFRLEAVPEETVIKLILKKIDEINIIYGAKLEFLGFKNNKYRGVHNTKLILKCNIHNHIWDTAELDDFLRRTGISCPICRRISGSKMSKLEALVTKELENYFNNDEILPQHEINIFDKIFNKSRKIIVDIFIPSINTFLEIDGEQHTNFIPLFHHKYSDFIRQVNRDNCLINYCKENNIILLKIPYKDKLRIKEILKEFIENSKDITTKVEPKLLPIPYGQDIVN